MEKELGRDDKLVLKIVVRPSEKVTAKPYSVSPSGLVVEVEVVVECHPAGNQAR